MDMESTASAAEVRAALLDFTERRPQIWPGIDPAQYKVIEVADTWADIREGSKGPGGGFWAVERYDWSDPETVKWTVKESNFSIPGSYVSATITPKPEGGSHIHVTWNRTGSTLLGKMVAMGIKWSGGAPVKASMRKGLANIESNAGAGVS
jgi:hypothetical protein